MLSWSSAWTEDQTQGAGKHSGIYVALPTSSLLLCRVGRACVRSFNPIPGMNKRNNNQFEPPRRRYKLINLVNGHTKAFRRRLSLSSRAWNIQLILTSSYMSYWQTCEKTLTKIEASTEVLKAPSQYDHRNLWTLKLVKIPLCHTFKGFEADIYPTYLRIKADEQCLAFADCRLQTADCRLQNADCGLQTLTTDNRLQTANSGPQAVDLEDSRS